MSKNNEYAVNNYNIRPNNSVKTRIEWLDIAKGLGVFLVVIGHLWYNCLFPVVNQIIYSFHMPMFFVLSGFVFKKGQLKLGSFIVAKSKRLLLPTFIFFVLGVIALIISKASLITILKTFFFIEGFCPLNAPCWYFITLFQLLVIAYFFNLDKLSFLFKGIVILVVLILGFFVYEFEIFLPFGINRTIISLVFFTIGSMIGQANRENKKIQKTYLKVLTCLVFIILWLLFGVVLNGKVSFYQMDIGNYCYFIIAGVCGSIVFIEFSKLLQNTKILKRFLIKTSQNSILIIGTHYFIVYIFKQVMGNFNLFGTWQYSLIVLCFSFVTILIYNFLGVFFKKHFPAITGDVK